MLPRKQMFADALMKHVPLAAHIRRVLDERPGHRAPAARFLRELEDHLSEEEAERVLDTVINWGRHAEIFAYDYDDEVPEPGEFLTGAKSKALGRAESKGDTRLPGTLLNDGVTRLREMGPRGIRIAARRHACCKLRRWAAR